VNKQKFIASSWRSNQGYSEMFGCSYTTCREITSCAS